MNHDEIDKKYLYKENRILRIQIKEANQLKELHKDAVYKLSQPHISTNHVISILLDLISSSANDNKIVRLNQQILQLQSKLMVLEKIVEETDNNEKQTYHLLADDFNKIKLQNQKLEGQLHKFYQKIGEVDYLSGLVTKYKEIIAPSDQSLAFKKEQEQLLDVLFLQKETIKKLTEEKQKLLKINVHMKDQVEKQKDQVRNMTMIIQNPDLLNNSVNNGDASIDNGTNNILDLLEPDSQGKRHKTESHENHNGNANGNHHNHSLFNISSHNTSVLNTSARGLNTTINFLKMQKKIIKQEDEQNFGEESELSSDNQDIAELNVLFPDKVEKIKNEKKTSKVPYLNMVKVRELMTKRQNKLRKQIQADNRHINPTDKIIKLETEMEITRKQLTNQSLKFRTMSEENKQILRMNEELAYRNQLLVLSNQKLRTNYQNMYKDYQLTKIIALRFERGLQEKEKGKYMQNELNTTKELVDKVSNAEALLKKVFHGKSQIQRSQSEETL